MERFSARLTKTSFGALVATMPRDLALIPVSWSASDRGGCKQCSIEASGSAESLASLCGWLGDRLEIYNDAQSLVWHGILWDIEVSLGNITVNLSLDQVYNKIAVIYPFVLPDGTQESRTTTWAQNQNSIDRYGTRELLYGMPESFAHSADFVRDHLLGRLRDPGPIVNTQNSSEFSARLTGQGLWYKAEAVYFNNPDGLEEHIEESGSAVIGRYMTSTGISFGTLTPGTPPEADEMWIVPGDFDPLTTGDTFTVTGAAVGANNDTYTIEGQDANFQISISGTFAAEAAGATVKLSMGESEALDNIAQSFQLATAWTVTHVSVRVRQLGTPSDNFRIGIYPDSSGVPGTVLTANETAGSALSTELTWTEFAFATPVALAALTTYWIGIRRTGTANLDDGYEVVLDEDLGYDSGVFKHYNGTTWVARVPDAHMAFRVIGEISSTAQLEKALTVVEDFANILVQVDSDIPVRQFTDNDRTAMEEINEMLDAGTSAGERLIAWVTPDDSIVVDIPPASSDMNLVLGEDGKLNYPNGSHYPSGRLIYGQNVNIDSLMLLDGLGIRANRGPSIYVQGSEFDAATDRLSISSEGALDPFTALMIRRG